MLRFTKAFPQQTSRNPAVAPSSRPILQGGYSTTLEARQQARSHNQPLLTLTMIIKH